MKLQLLQDFNNCGLTPPIHYKLDPKIGKKSDRKNDLLNVDIKTQLGEVNS